MKSDRFESDKRLRKNGRHIDTFYFLISVAWPWPWRGQTLLDNYRDRYGSRFILEAIPSYSWDASSGLNRFIATCFWSASWISVRYRIPFLCYDISSLPCSYLANSHKLIYCITRIAINIQGVHAIRFPVFFLELTRF